MSGLPRRYKVARRVLEHIGMAKTLPVKNWTVSCPHLSSSPCAPQTVGKTIEPIPPDAQCVR